jgi:serine/threonine-protein phosphatase 2A regulatory subunit B
MRKGLTLPKARAVEKNHCTKLKHTFKSGLESNLHSLSLSSDFLQFLSSDEKTVNLWDLERPDADVFNVVNFNKAKGKKEKKSSSQKLISSAQFSQFS